MAKIILIQPQPAPRLDDPENLARALKLLERCRGEKADIICFPEYFPYQGDNELAQAARDLEAYIVAGLVAEEKGLRFNTATLFDRQGNLVGRQTKHCVARLERRAYGVTPGETYQTFPADFGVLGLPVCIDFWGQPHAARELAAQGADLILNPSIFPILKGHWRAGALVRAFDYYLPVVGVNTSGHAAEIGGRSYAMQAGGSFAIQPPAPADDKEMSRLVRVWDHLDHWVILEAGEEEAILTLNLDLDGPRLWRPIVRERFGIRGE